jgi:hypothetical protein
MERLLADQSEDGVRRYRRVQDVLIYPKVKE